MTRFKVAASHRK